MRWTPNCTEVPHYWTMNMPPGFDTAYQVMLTVDGFVPMRIDRNDEKATWERLSKKGLEILGDAMNICEAAYRKGSP